MAPARDTFGKKGEGGRPFAVALARGICVALLLGLPPVLGLPSAIAVSSRALAFSSLRAFAALGLLAGAAVSGGLSARVRRGLFWVGACSAVAYALLTSAAFLCLRDVAVNQAIYLGFVSYGLVGLGSLSCGAAMLDDVAPAGLATGCPAAGKRPCGASSLVVGLPGFTLLSLGILWLSVGLEPNWTLARLAYARAGGFDADELLQVLVYALADMVGPGPQTLDLGVFQIDARSLAFLLLAWFAVSICAGRGEGLSGIALGVIAARCLAELAPLAPSDYRVAGGLEIVGGIAALLVLAFFARRATPTTAASAVPQPAASPDLSALSPREREAVGGRLAKKSSAEVAAQMGVSPSTVRNLQARAAKKLGVASLDELCEKGASVSKPAPEHKEALKSRASIAAVVAAAACALCAAAGAMGGWISVALAGEVVLACSLASRCILGKQASELRFVSTTPLYGAGYLIGGCAGVVVAAAGSSLAAATGVVLVATATVLALSAHVSASAAPAPSSKPLARNVAAAATLFICAFTAVTCGFFAVLACCCAASLAYLTSKRALRSVLAVLAFFGAGVLMGAFFSRVAVGAGGLLAVAGSMSGVAAAASLASLALGFTLLMGVLSVVGVLRGNLARRDLLAARGQGPSFDERLEALCRLRGLNQTCAEVTSCLLSGMSGPATCEFLAIAPGTLNTARRTVYRAFGVHTASGLASTVSAQLESARHQG